VPWGVGSRVFADLLTIGQQLRKHLGGSDHTVVHFSLLFELFEELKKAAGRNAEFVLGKFAPFHAPQALRSQQPSRAGSRSPGCR